MAKISVIQRHLSTVRLGKFQTTYKTTVTRPEMTLKLLLESMK